MAFSWWPFYSLGLFYASSEASRMLYILRRRPTYSAIARPSHTNLSTFPEPSCWLRCKEGGPGGSHMYHKCLGSEPCPFTHPQSRFQGEGCRCPCTGAGSGPRTVSGASYSRGRTRSVLRDQECSVQRKQDG